MAMTISFEQSLSGTIGSWLDMAQNRETTPPIDVHQGVWRRNSQTGFMMARSGTSQRRLNPKVTA